jgi:hypothetical protein
VDLVHFKKRNFIVILFSKNLGQRKVLPEKNIQIVATALHKALILTE